MLYQRSAVSLQRGSDTTPTTYNEPFDVPVVNLAPYEHLIVTYAIYYNIFLVPRSGKESDARGRVRYFKASLPQLIAIELLQNDWKNENFEEGDEVLLYGVANLVNPGNTNFAAFHAKINSIKANTAVFSIYSSNIAASLYSLNFFFVFLVDHERRNRGGVLPAAFQTIFKRFGDVAGDVSPLSGLRYAEPHSDGFLVELDQHNILPYSPTELPFTGILDTTFGLDQIVYPVNFFLGWTALPPVKRNPAAFRLSQRRLRLANFFSYRQEYNTLSRSAQRDLYHENADLITKLVLNNDEREISVPLRIRLLHANVNESGAPEFNVVPTITFAGSNVTSIMPSIPSIYTLRAAAFALTTDNNTHHFSTLIRHQHDLTRYRIAPVFNLPAGARLATLPIATIANDLRRNPFETYVVALWHFVRTTGGSSEEIVVCSDAIPLDIDENINKIVAWQNDASLNYHYHRFNNIVLNWNETEPVERGEYQVYIRVRKDANSPVYTAQQYTFKIDESTRVLQTASIENFYALHYPHQNQIVSPNIFITSNSDATIITNAPNNYTVYLRVPPPSFDFPLVRNPNIRPVKGTLFHWFVSLNAPVFNTTSGSAFYAQPIRVADGQMRVIIFTPSGKIYATNWRQVRAQEPTELLWNNHHVAIINNPNFVVVFFPNSVNPPQNIKSNVKLFQDNINTLKPIAEAAHDSFSGSKTTDNSKILPLFGFFGSRQYFIVKNNLPQGRYKLHCIASYADDTTGNTGFQGYVDDIEYTFTIGTPLPDDTPIAKEECCYNPPVIRNENIPYITFDDATDTYNQQNIVIPPNPAGTAWQNFVNAYGCCFKIYNNNTILRENFVDVIALFNNRINNIAIAGQHWFRYRGFLQTDGYEISEESYVRSDLSEEPVLRTYRKKYVLELFLTDCDIKQLDFQKLARRWIIRNYTNSLLPSQLEVLVKNIEQTAEYNKLKVTVSLIDYKPDEYRHK